MVGTSQREPGRPCEACLFNVGTLAAAVTAASAAPADFVGVAAVAGFVGVAAVTGGTVAGTVLAGGSVGCGNTTGTWGGALAEGGGRDAVDEGTKVLVRGGGTRKAECLAADALLDSSA